MSQNSKKERVRRSVSTGSNEHANTEGTVKYLPFVHGLLEYLQQFPNLDSAVEEANSVERGIPDLLNENKDLKDEVTKQKKAIDDICKRYDDHLMKKNSHITKLKEELEETRMRLSKLMAMRIANNNPNIADLSDQNRPTKLAERYGELYDNEWTDAFEMLTKTGRDDKTAIDILRDILTKTYKYCRNKCETSVERFEEAFTMMPKNHQIKAVDIPEEVLKGFKDYRKAHADEVVEMSLQAFLDELRKGGSELAQQALSVEKFLTSCFRLCWMMSIQDPPTYIDQETSNGDPINKDKYRDYMVTGTIIDYIVWPCLYIEKGGAVLYKGVAQCYPKRKPRRPASAAPRLNTQSSQKENEKERPTTAARSPDEMESRSHSNQQQSPVAGFNGDDSSVPEHVGVSDNEEKPTDESSASEQTTETGTDENDGQVPSGTTQGNQVSRTLRHSDHQTNKPVETVVYPSASTYDQLPEDPYLSKENARVLRFIAKRGHERTKLLMGNERYQKCLEYCNANNIDCVNLEKTSSSEV